MFRKKKKEEKPKPEPPLTDAEIYTIPDKFYLPNLQKGGDKTKLVGVVIMVLAFLAIVIGGYFLVTKVIL